MPETVTPLARITAEAIAAANSGQSINAACPYPFPSAAGLYFKQVFIETLHAKFEAAKEAKRKAEQARATAAQAAMKDVA